MSMRRSRQSVIKEKESCERYRLHVFFVEDGDTAKGDKVKE